MERAGTRAEPDKLSWDDLMCSQLSLNWLLALEKRGL
jgi:hypothetical protein